MLSILIPTNNTDYIVELLDSIVVQTHDIEMEIIVAVDGCPKCTEFLKKIQDVYELNIYDCPENMGVYKTINTLLDLAEGDEVLIFGSDDIMLPNLLSTIYSINADVVQFRYYEIIEGKIYYQRTHHFAAGAIWFNRKALKTLGGYKPWKYSADSEFVERVKSTDLVHVQIDNELFYYRNHNKNLTATVDLHDRAIQRSKIKFSGYNKNELWVNPVKNKGEWI